MYAVSNHYGSLYSGHYTAFAKNFVDKEWYEFDDSQVTIKTEQDCVTSGAYILFYKRR